MKRRRRRRRWTDWLNLARPWQRFNFRWSLALFAVLLMACEEQPVSIRVKGPRDALESVKMEPTFAPFEKKGDTMQLRASAFKERHKKEVFIGRAPVKWESSDTTVATVNQMGLVTILSSGVVKIKATSIGYEKELSDDIELKAVIVKAVRIVDPEKGEKSFELALGEKKVFKAEVLNDRDKPIEGIKIRWRSSSYSATVMPDGEVEGRALGTAQIIVEAKGQDDRLDILVTDWKKSGRKKKRK